MIMMRPYFGVLLLLLLLDNRAESAIVQNDEEKTITCSDDNTEHLVCREPDVEPSGIIWYTFVDCDVQDDGTTVYEGCIRASRCRNSCIKKDIWQSWAYRDCQDFTIKNCQQVYCVQHGCNRATFENSVVSTNRASGATGMKFVDSVVYCDYCYNATFIRSRVHSYVTTSDSRFEDSVVYAHDDRGSTFVDSKVACDACLALGKFIRSEVTVLNHRAYVNSFSLHSSKVTCHAPRSWTYDPSDGRTLCGTFGTCSCCLGTGCDLLPNADDVQCTLEPNFCDRQIVTDDGQAQTCMEERNPFCVLTEPFCVGDKIGAFWGDPHIVSFDGLGFECQVTGEHVLMRSKDRSRQIHGLFTPAVAPNVQLTVTTGVAIQSPFFPPGKRSLQIYTSNDLSQGENLGGCSIRYFEDKSTTGKPISLDTLFKNSADYVKITHNTDPWPHAFIEFPTLGMSLTLTVHKYPLQQGEEEKYVCYFSTDLYLSCQHDHGSLEGLLRNADYDKSNDWKDPTGSAIHHFNEDRRLLCENAYNYCSTWCVTDVNESIFINFQYWDSTGWWELASKCGDPYVGNWLFAICNDDRGGLRNRNLRDFPAAIDPQVEAICGQDVSCLMDGITFGVEAAEFYVYNRAHIAALQAELSEVVAMSQPPSSTPSSPPTVSAQPSFAPSDVPTVTAQPTDEPNGSSNVLSCPEDSPKCKNGNFAVCHRNKGGKLVTLCLPDVAQGPGAEFCGCCDDNDKQCRP